MEGGHKSSCEPSSLGQTEVDRNAGARETEHSIEMISTHVLNDDLGPKSEVLFFVFSLLELSSTFDSALALTCPLR